MKFLKKYIFFLLMACCVSLSAQQEPLNTEGEAAVVEAESAYRLGAGDVLRILVLGEPDLTLSAQLDQNGVIVYPYLGEINVLNRTVLQVKQIIAEGLSGDYLLNPKVTVSVENYRTIFIGGEVARTGSVSYQPGITVEKAILLTGGFTERSARNRITVESENGEKQRVDLDYMLQPGDIVNVPRRFF